MSQHDLVWEHYPLIASWQATGVTGTLMVAHAVHSPQLRNQRDLFVYLPAGYQQSEERYPVVYLHDAQNLFDPALSFAGDTWQAGEAMTGLARDGIEAIVVGLSHMGDQRIVEYNPFPHWKRGKGPRHLAFVIETVKPAIDRVFRTRPERESTVIAGSSMGGLISLYSFYAAPLVFGAAGVMSPSLWVANGAMYELIETNPMPGGRIWLDHGSKEPSVEPMARLLDRRGYKLNETLRYVVGKGAKHSESAWAKRLPAMLRFLLTGK